MIYLQFIEPLADCGCAGCAHELTSVARCERLTAYRQILDQMIENLPTVANRAGAAILITAEAADTSTLLTPFDTLDPWDLFDETNIDDIEGHSRDLHIAITSIGSGTLRIGARRFAFEPAARLLADLIGKVGHSVPRWATTLNDTDANFLHHVLDNQTGVTPYPASPADTPRVLTRIEEHHARWHTLQPLLTLNAEQRKWLISLLEEEMTLPEALRLLRGG